MRTVPLLSKYDLYKAEVPLKMQQGFMFLGRRRAW